MKRRTRDHWLGESPDRKTGFKPAGTSTSGPGGGERLRFASRTDGANDLIRLKPCRSCGGDGRLLVQPNGWHSVVCDSCRKSTKGFRSPIWDAAVRWVEACWNNGEIS